MTFCQYLVTFTLALELVVYLHSCVYVVVSQVGETTLDPLLKEKVTKTSVFFHGQQTFQNKLVTVDKFYRAAYLQTLVGREEDARINCLEVFRHVIKVWIPQGKYDCSHVR